MLHINRGFTIHFQITPDGEWQPCVHDCLRDVPDFFDPSVVADRKVWNQVVGTIAQALTIMTSDEPPFSITISIPRDWSDDGEVFTGLDTYFSSALFTSPSGHRFIRL